MSRRGLAVLGGVIQGFGQGISAQAQAVRERALRQMEIDAAEARSLRSDTLARDEGAATRTAAATNTDKTIGAQKDISAASLTAAESRNNADIKSRERISADDNKARGLLLQSSYIDDQGHRHTTTAGGKDTDTGITVQEKDLPRKDKLFYEAARDLATRTVTEQYPVDASEPDGPQKTVTTKSIDPAILRAELKKSKNPDLLALAEAPDARLVGGDGGSDALPADVENPPGADPAGAGSATVMPGGYAPSTRGLTAPGDTPAPADATAAPADATQQADGSIEAPHRPQSKTDVEAIKSGEYFINPADGRKYRKK